MFDDQMRDKPITDDSAELPAGLAVAPSPEVSPRPSPVIPSIPAGELPKPVVPQAPEVPPRAPEVVVKPQPILPPESQLKEFQKPKKRYFGLKVFLVILAGLACIGVAGVIAYTIIVQSPKEDSVVPVETDEEEADEVVVPVEEEEEEIIAVDSDGDGLTDDEEAQFGTNPNISDTDDDGLNDREEVRVYDTDPLDPDTDADSFLDGEEVMNGYNPNGEGKLFDLPK